MLCGVLGAWVAHGAIGGLMKTLKNNCFFYTVLSIWKFLGGFFGNCFVCLFMSDCIYDVFFVFRSLF